MGFSAAVSLAVSGACRQEQIMARFPLFFITAFLVIAAMIAVALLPLMPKPIVAVEARKDQNSFIIDGKALSHIVSARGFPVTAAPGPRGDQSGTRLATLSALAPGAKYAKGARLMLGPQTLAALSGRSFDVIITARSLANTPAANMAFGLVTGGPVNWQQMAVAPTSSAVRYTLPASSQPISGLAFWPAIEGNGHGIEITSIVLQPLSSTSGTP